MRRKKKEIHDTGTIENILRSAPVGHLGTITSSGYPMIKPLNFVYDDGNIYFHSALEGEKLDDIHRDNRVCFEVDEPLGFVKAIRQPCEARYLFKSVIIKGRAFSVTNLSEKITALKKLMEKYQLQDGCGDFPEEKLSITTVVRINIEEMTGKEDL